MNTPNATAKAKTKFKKNWALIISTELLFEIDNINDWKVYDRDIILIKDGIVYLYNDKTGLVKILSSNELKYNYKDIVKIWKS